MNIYKSGLFPYIDGDQLGGRDVVLTIRDCRDEKLPGHDGRPVVKPLIVFQETSKCLILNKTNAKTVIKLYGKETAGWVGKKITLYPTTVKAFGEEYTAVRIRKDQPKAEPVMVEETAEDLAEKNDDLFPET
jgi:hypothetical protein